MHKLSEVNTTDRLAICSICGFTEIRLHGKSWACIFIIRNRNRRAYLKNQEKRKKYASDYRKNNSEIVKEKKKLFSRTPHGRFANAKNIANYRKSDGD